MAEYQPQISNNSLPPQSIDLEEAILGGILLDPNAIGRIIDIIKPEAFYLKAHQQIYEAAFKLHSQGKPTDLITITAWLSDQGLLEKIGGPTKLAQLVDRTISAVNIDNHAKTVMDKYMRRQLISAGGEISQLGFDTTKELENILDESEQKIFQLTQKRPQQGLVSISESLVKTYNEIESLHDNIALPGITSDFYDLDAMTSGFQRSDLIIVAARPSMGKTSFALNIAHNIATKHKLPIAIFSLEMSKEQLALRLLASESGIPSNRLRSGRLSQTDFDPLNHAVGVLSELPIYIDDTANLTVIQMRSEVRRLQAEKGTQLGLVLLDYLQLMEGGGENRVQELSRITRSLKGLAREANVPVIALSQLSRAVEQRTNKRPMLSDLRESGCLSGDSLIELADTNTRVAIRELVGKNNFTVFALNEATMKIEKAKVTNAFFTGIKPVFCLKTRLGRTIKATANHQFLTIQGWKRLDELSLKEFIALPRYLPSSQISTMGEKELALLGHLIGDGCTLPSHSIQYTTREEDLAEIVVSLATEIFCDQIKPRIKKEHQWYQVYLSSGYHLTHNVKNPVTKWLSNLGVFGLRSYEKFVPNLVFEQPKNSIAVFLRHLWSTDGSIKLLKTRLKLNRPVAYYSSSSLRLATDVQSLLIRLEINARLSQHPQKNKGRDQYHVTITGKPDIIKFLEVIGSVGKYKQKTCQEIYSFIQGYKSNPNKDLIPKDIWRLLAVPAMKKCNLTTRQMQEQMNNKYSGTSYYKSNLSRERAAKLGEVVQCDRLKSLANSDVYWDEIKSIELLGETEVYDLTVDNFHNFIANNIIVHNSIEQDADLVMMLYRDEYYNPDTVDRGISEINIAKHRNGPTGIVKLLFNPELTKFLNLQKSSY